MDPALSGKEQLQKKLWQCSLRDFLLSLHLPQTVVLVVVLEMGVIPDMEGMLEMEEMAAIAEVVEKVLLAD